jgi:hypothetical protein
MIQFTVIVLNYHSNISWLPASPLHWIVINQSTGLKLFVCINNTLNTTRSYCYYMNHTLSKWRYRIIMKMILRGSTITITLMWCNRRVFKMVKCIYVIITWMHKVMTDLHFMVSHVSIELQQFNSTTRNFTHNCKLNMSLNMFSSNYVK